jgi:hypothetical protein
MEYFARTNFLNSRQQLFQDHPIIPKLIFGNAHDQHSNPEAGKILLKLKLRSIVTSTSNSFSAAANRAPSSNALQPWS